MQWLIDLLIEAYDIYHVNHKLFVDRGDPSAVDFDEGDLTADGAWHTLDLSGIVPSGASVVFLSLLCRTSVAQAFAGFRKNGNVNIRNISYINTQVANIAIGYDLIVFCDSNRLIEYLLWPGSWTYLYITIKGWWIP